MLKNITWTEYFTIILIASLIYYMVVFLLFFKKSTMEKLLVFKGKSMTISPALNALNSAEISLTDEINSYLQESAHRSAAKNEVIFALQSIISKYGIDKNSANQEEINRQIQSACMVKCGIHLNDDEIAQVWIG